MNRNEPWHSLWSALCHQSDVYTASYAAFPHIIDAATRCLPENRIDYLILASAIEFCRHRPASPDVPAQLVDGYSSSIALAHRLVVDELELPHTELEYRHLLASLASFQGHARLAAAVADLDLQDPLPDVRCGRYAPRIQSIRMRLGRSTA